MRGAILIEELELARLRENESMEGGLALHADLFLNVKIPLYPRHQRKVHMFDSGTNRSTRLLTRSG